MIARKDPDARVISTVHPDAWLVHKERPPPSGRLQEELVVDDDADVKT
jgi:hypothetical protein